MQTALVWPEQVQECLQEEDKKAEQEVKDGLSRPGKGCLSLAPFAHEAEYLMVVLSLQHA